MPVVVTLPGFISDLIQWDGGKPKRRLTVDAASLADLRDFFVTRHPGAATRIWDEHARLRKNVILVHNDTPLPRGDVDLVTFSDGDELCLIMQFAGG
jgi:hypothetical protein